MSSASSNYAILDPATDLLPNAQTRAGLANGLATLDANTKIPTAQLYAGVFGTEFQDSERNTVAVITVTLPTFTNYLTMSTPVTLPAGRYKIGWHYIAQHDNATSDAVCKVHVTGATVINLNEPGFQGYAQWEPADAAATQTVEHSGYRVVSLLAGINNILMDFSNSANQTNVRRGALYLFRVP